ncbi:immune inhibitor A domain-containing protein [Kitasatospora sp. NPDC048365]|uniref:immune inhibitor A domain-containing protein n=1 Tax=Kitasatospora sp. NPDC048365 TaxID=3364050 RepID=UPI00371861E1
MSTRVAAVTAIAVAAACGACLLPAAAQAAPTAPADRAAADPADRTAAAGAEHNLPGPLTGRVEAEQKAATEQLMAGTAVVEQHGAGSSVRLGPEKYVELARERTDRIFTVLVEFGDRVDTATRLPDGSVKYGGAPGPAHNAIARPDRSKDNSTAWQADYNQRHYQDLYFSTTGDSLRTYYEKQSSGRYSVDGQVTDWVKVPWNEARYGADFCGDIQCGNGQDLVRDGLDAWVADQKAKGRTAEQIRADLAQFDRWDRYDFDGAGDFDEPDGYLDHFQIVHAGEDQSAGGGVQGTDALWAHRGYVYGSAAGKTGPEGNRLGGTPVGDTGLWVGDYTMQPENGGLGVFAHEFGHDLGLPDLYDTSGQGIDNSVGYWSLMSSGSWLGEGRDEIGDKPADLDVWSKLQLGWLTYDRASAGKVSVHRTGPVEYNTKLPQAVVVELPKKTVTTDINTPYAGGNEWWSGSADGLNVSLSREVDLTGAKSAVLTAKGWYELEKDFDYGYAEVSADGGATWAVLTGTFDGVPIPANDSGTPALTGDSAGRWGDLAYPLDAYAGQKVRVRFRVTTDGSVHLKGLALDDLAVTADGRTLFTDGAESDDNGWTAKGFSRTTGHFTKDYAQYYLVENRQYVSYDRMLATGPYYFSSTVRPLWVEHYRNQNGLLIWLWDTSQADNNVANHPGQGLVLPVDAHPAPLRWTGGTAMRPRLQGYDSTFGFEATDGLSLHRADVLTTLPGEPGVPVFDDHNAAYWDPAIPFSSVKVPDTGTRIELLWNSTDTLESIVMVRPAR